MAAATAELFTTNGMSGHLAAALAAEINDAPADPLLLIGLGMSPFLATEIVAQIDNSTTGILKNLTGLGCPPLLATAIFDAIEDI